MEQVSHIKKLIIKDQEVYFLMAVLFGYILAYIDPYNYTTIPRLINVFIRGSLFLGSIYFIVRNFEIIKRRKTVILTFILFFLFYFFKLNLTFSSFSLSEEAFHSLRNSVYYYGVIVTFVPIIALLSLQYEKIDFKKFYNCIFWFLLILLGINFLHTNFIFEDYQSNGRGGIFRLYYITVGHLGLSLVIMSLYGIFILKIKKYYWVLGILLGLFPIYVSAARSPVLALLVILFIFLILINKKKYWIFFSIMIIVSLILLFVMYQTGFGNKFIFFERINAAIFERNASGRSFYLNKGIEIFINHPLAGGRALFEDGMYPHNIFVEVLMSTGVLGMALFIIYYKFVAQSFFKVLKHIDKYKESGVIIFFFLQYFILSQTSGNIYSSFECWYFGAVVIGLGYINFTNEEIKSNDSRGYTAGNH